MRHFLFLVERMATGFGVSVVVHNVALQLARHGHRVRVGCLETDSSFSGYPITEVPVDVERVARLAATDGSPVIVAHTSPFFELLPHLARSFPCWAWEHGDPTSSFFDADAAERERIRLNKQLHCYPAIDGVVAISEFIRHDIAWPSSEVVYNGCDHAPDLGSKNRDDLALATRAPLTLGTLMRLGRGEARYKGNDLFIELCDRLRARVPLRARVMGRGTAEDAAPFEERGIEVALNASDEDKWRFLRGLDVFITCSLWEGFNLPLAEAQALGTMGIAYDVGAHPEVCPFIVSRIDEAVTLIEGCHRDRHRLLEHSRTSYHFVRGRFTWERTQREFLRILDGRYGANGTVRSGLAQRAVGRLVPLVRRARALLRQHDLPSIVTRSAPPPRSTR